MTGVAEFVSVLVPSALVGVILFLVFCFNRLRKPDVFQPRLEAPNKRKRHGKSNQDVDVDVDVQDLVGGRKRSNESTAESVDTSEILNDIHPSPVDVEPSDTNVQAKEKLLETVEKEDEKEGDGKESEPFVEERTLDGLPRPPLLSSGLLSWFIDLMKIEEKEILKSCGLDVVVYLRTMKLCLQLCLISALYGFIILIPVYSTGEGPEDKSGGAEEEMALDFDGLDVISMSNIADGSARLWAPFFAVYITTISACYLIYKNYSEIFEMAREFHSREKVQNYSVMVTQVPSYLQNIEAIHEYFNEYPGNVTAISISKDVKDLQELVDKRKKIAKKLQKVKKEIAKKGINPTHRTGKCCSEKVDSHDFYTKQLMQLDRQIKKSQSEPKTFGPVAFVTFSKLESVSQSITDTPQYDRDWMKQSSLANTQRSPEPRDVRWQSLCVPHDKQQTSEILVNCFMAVLLLFWTIPVSFLSSIMNLDTLQAALPFLKPILDLRCQ